MPNYRAAEDAATCTPPAVLGIRLDSPYFDVELAAEYAHTTPLVVRRAFRRHELTGIKRGRTLLFTAEWVDEWLAASIQRAEL
jgi:hypothetical protein